MAENRRVSRAVSAEVGNCNEKYQRLIMVSMTSTLVAFSKRFELAVFTFTAKQYFITTFAKADLSYTIDFFQIDSTTCTCVSCKCFFFRVKVFVRCNVHD